MAHTDTLDPVAFIEARRGRLFRLKLERNTAARRTALDSIHVFPNRVTVRIGGRMRGETVICTSRRDAEQRVKRHYDAELWKHIIRVNADSDHAGDRI